MAHSRSSTLESTQAHLGADSLCDSTRSCSGQGIVEQDSRKPISFLRVVAQIPAEDVSHLIESYVPRWRAIADHPLDAVIDRYIGEGLRSLWPRWERPQRFQHKQTVIGFVE